MLLPHVPLAVNVNGRFTVVPLLVMIPYVCGPLGEVTPPDACRVATRLEVLPQPKGKQYFYAFNLPLISNAKHI